MSHTLPYDEIEMSKDRLDCYIDKSDDILNNTDDDDIGYFIEIDLKNSHIIKEKTKNFPFCP